MALPTCIYFDLTSSGVNLTWGPMIVVTAWSADVIPALRTVKHCLTLKTAARCVLLEALCCRKCATQRQMAATAHARGWPVAPCTIDYPLTPFLCVAKRRLRKLAMAQVIGEAVVAGVG